jgi:hypothetical protein
MLQALKPSGFGSAIRLKKRFFVNSILIICYGDNPFAAALRHAACDPPTQSRRKVHAVVPKEGDKAVAVSRACRAAGSRALENEYSISARIDFAQR